MRRCAMAVVAAAAPTAQLHYYLCCTPRRTRHDRTPTHLNLTQHLNLLFTTGPNIVTYLRNLTWPFISVVWGVYYEILLQLVWRIYINEHIAAVTRAQENMRRHLSTLCRGGDHALVQTLTPFGQVHADILSESHDWEIIMPLQLLNPFINYWCMTE